MTTRARTAGSSTSRTPSSIARVTMSTYHHGPSVTSMSLPGLPARRSQSQSRWSRRGRSSTSTWTGRPGRGLRRDWRSGWTLKPSEPRPIILGTSDNPFHRSLSNGSTQEHDYGSSWSWHNHLSSVFPYGSELVSGTHHPIGIDYCRCVPHLPQYSRPGATLWVASRRRTRSKQHD